MTIIIPTPLRQYVDGQSKIEVSAPTVRGAIDALTLDRPELRKHLFNSEGKIRAFVNVYLNDEDVRYLPQKEDSVVLENDTLTIIPSIAGGC
jgi:adenylyltransferase/sulfurtransferase